jgi:hypothetical protein
VPYSTIKSWYGTSLYPPSTFIYDKNRQLIKKFIGATKIQDIIDVIIQNE